MADFSSLNGYNVKDAKARQDLSALDQKVDDTKTDLEGDLAALDQKVDDTKTDLEGELDQLDLESKREEDYNRYHLFVMPVSLPAFFDRLKIYESNDNRNYKHNINPANFMRTGGSNTWYVDPTAATSGTAGTSQDPDGTLYRAINNHASANDTVILRPGIYRRADFAFAENSAKVYKSINIIAEEGAILTNSDELEWSKTANRSNVYQANRSAVQNVIDIRGKDNGIFAKLTKVTSISAVDSTLNSWYTESNVLYVNIGEQVTNDKVVANLGTGNVPMPINSVNYDQSIYLEGLVCLGGDRSIVRIESSTSYSCFAVANKCRFLFASDVAEGGCMQVRGADTIFVDCEASYAATDGFGYHAANNRTCNAIEINCIGSNNGVGNTYHANPIHNGSTVHDGCKIVRIDGRYFENNGSNVADVNDNTVSININCRAYDSQAQTHNVYDSDFCAQQSGATMYLYNCWSNGGNSDTNIFAVSGTTINLQRTKHKTTGGGGTINVN